MTAGVLPDNNKLVVLIGGADAFTLTFTEYNSGTKTWDPIDLSGKTFVAQVRAVPGGKELLNIVVDDTDAATGQLTLSWNAALTKDLPPREATWGIIDGDDYVWIEDTATIRHKTPENV